MLFETQVPPENAVQINESQIEVVQIRNWWYFERFIEAGPKIAMRKQIHSQQSCQIRKRPVKIGSKPEEMENQHCNQCCPNLDLDSIRNGAHEDLDLKVLLQGFKEGLNPSTLFVDGSSGRTQFQIVAQEYQHFLCLRVIDFDPPKRLRTFLDDLGSSELDHLIFEEMSAIGDFVPSNYFIESVLLDAGDKIEFLGTPSTKQGIVIVAPVIDDDSPGIEIKLTSHLKSKEGLIF